MAYILAGGAGLLLAWFLSRAPELRSLRLAQLIFVPIAFVAALSVLPDPSAPSRGVGDIGVFAVFLGILGFIIILLAPNIAHNLGAAVSGFLDPHDWQPVHEEVPLREVNRLIDKDRYQDALAELEALLKKYKPTYDALHLKAKLLNHFQHYNEAVAALLQMLRLSATSTQQQVVMELLSSLEAHLPASPGATAPGVRTIRIDHELMLFNAGANDFSAHKEIPPGEYSVEEIHQGRHCWLVLQNESWGNAEICWNAVAESAPIALAPVKRGFLYRVARMQQDLTLAIKGKPWRQAKANARAYFKEAGQLIRAENWNAALPLLQRASADDPDNYEIAYRLAQAAWHVGPPSSAAQAVNSILSQSQWTDDQTRMLKQVRA